MPDYSININTDAGDREAGLQQVVANYNATVQARNAALPEGAEAEPLLDGKQYLQLNFDAVVESYATQVVSKAFEDLKDNFSRADQATRDEAVILLAQFQPIAAEAASLKVV